MGSLALLYWFRNEPTGSQHKGKNGYQTAQPPDRYTNQH